MSYNILFIRHSGSCLFSSPNSASQYGRAMVAATALNGGHFVCPDPWGGRLSSPGLPLSVAGTNQPACAPSARTQGGFYGQSAPALDPGSPPPLSTATPAHQSHGREGVGAVVKGLFYAWLSTKPKCACNAFYNIAQIAMPQRSWLRFTISWRLLRLATMK